MHVSHDEPTPGADRPDALRALLARALQTGAAGIIGGVDVLRESVCTYAQRQRADGVPAERVVIQLKELMQVSANRARFLDSEQRALVDSVIRWCIEEYYRAD